MFKKRPQIKNLSPLKTSERRKLADQIRKDYSLPEPQNESSSEQNGEQTSQPQTLTSIRNALLPDPTSWAKFTTTHGSGSSQISGTIYVGAHPGQEERVLWFQIGKDDRLIPTVYTLWQNPGLIPLLHIGESIVAKLKGGADLFAPGLIKPQRGFDEKAVKNAVVAVAGHATDTVPRWVGISKVDIHTLGDDAKGTAAEGLHWEGDEIWSWSAMNKGGVPAPSAIEGWPGLTAGLEEDVNSLGLEDDDDDGPEGEHVTGGVNIVDSVPVAEREVENHSAEASEERIPTTKEVDDAFKEAFVYSLYSAKKNNPGEPHGLDFPLTASYLIANMIQPHLRHQSTHYNIKKTSWKNAKKFIKYLDKEKFIKSKDRNGGETVILDIDFNDEAVKTFQPYRLPKPKVTIDPADDTGDSTKDAGTDQSLSQKLILQTYYRASAKLVPELLPSKTQFFTAQQVVQAVKTYIEDNPDLINESKKRYVKLNPFLANNVLGSNSRQEDTKILAAGEIGRDTLSRRILDDDHLCVPHWLLLRNEQTLESDPTLKPRAGQPPHVILTVERRGGNKVVTAIAGLEHFFINPHLIRPELQKKCAGSASVGQLVGGKPGMLEVQVQGDQRAVIEKDVLGKRGVKPEWIEVIDKTKKKGKK